MPRIPLSFRSDLRAFAARVARASARVPRRALTVAAGVAGVAAGACTRAGAPTEPAGGVSRFEASRSAAPSPVPTDSLARPDSSNTTQTPIWW